jgi:hypothetical protein
MWQTVTASPHQECVEVKRAIGVHLSHTRSSPRGSSTFHAAYNRLSPRRVRAGVLCRVVATVNDIDETSCSDRIPVTRITAKVCDNGTRKLFCPAVGPQIANWPFTFDGSNAVCDELHKRHWKRDSRRRMIKLGHIGSGDSCCRHDEFAHSCRVGQL